MASAAINFPARLGAVVIALLLRLSLAFVANTGRKRLTGHTFQRHEVLQAVNVIASEDQFTAHDESSVSVVSMNILAPYYQHLGLRQGNETASVNEAIQNDRISRIPLAVKRAARSRPDILLLQEVEGGDQPNLLVEKSLRDIGYTGYIWSSLYPNQDGRVDDCVGLAVAFDAQRFRCVQNVAFRRGQVVRLHDEKSKRAFVVANLHLNAKPSAIEARLRSVRSCMGHIKAVLDGEAATILLGGDLNSEDPSVTTRLITSGSIPFGTIRDRNYKATISKAVAKNLQHSFRFTSVYTCAPKAAPVTVCLKGRGPGIMDHLFLCTNISSNQSSSCSRKRAAAVPASIAGSKRQSRRQRALYSTSVAVDQGLQEEKQPLSIMSVLATVDSDDAYQKVLEGLPNVEAGFPSDHLPIGALLSQEPVVSDIYPEQKELGNSLGFINVPKGHSGLSGATARRRLSFKASSSVRQRHNQVLRTIAEWLPPGAKRDTSVMHFGIPQLRRKTRAPDVCCVIGNTLFVVEVTVVAAKNLEKAVEAKRQKYDDLVPTMRTSSYFSEKGLTVSDIMIVAFDEEGRASPSTLAALNTLMVAMNEQSVKGNGETLDGLLASIEQLILQSTRSHIAS